MKREDILALFPEASKEQIDAILDANGRDINEVKSHEKKATADLQAKLDAANEEKAGFESKIAELTGQVQKGLSAEELLAQKEAEAEQAKLDFTLKSNALEARAIFVELGLEKETLDALVAQVTVADEETTKKNAQAIFDVVKTQKEAAITATKDELLKGNPKIGGAETVAGMTKEDFNKLSYSKKLELIGEHPELKESFL